jgi:hypothetical protein
MKTVMTILCWFFSPVVPYPDGSCYCIIKLFLVVAHCFKKQWDCTSLSMISCMISHQWWIWNVNCGFAYIVFLSFHPSKRVSNAIVDHPTEFSMPWGTILSKLSFREAGNYLNWETFVSWDVLYYPTTQHTCHTRVVLSVIYMIKVIHIRWNQYCQCCVGTLFLWYPTPMVYNIALLNDLKFDHFVSKNHVMVTHKWWNWKNNCGFADTLY